MINNVIISLYEYYQFLNYTNIMFRISESTIVYQIYIP